MAWHLSSSVVSGFSVMISAPISIPLIINSWCVLSTVVTIRISGLVSRIIFSKSVKVGQDTPMCDFEKRRRPSLISQSPTNSTSFPNFSTTDLPHMLKALIPRPTMAILFFDVVFKKASAEDVGKIVDPASTVPVCRIKFLLFIKQI